MVVSEQFYQVLQAAQALTSEDQVALIRQLQQMNAIDQKRDVEEVLASIESNRWIPLPSARSSLELLREDRDG